MIADLVAPNADDAAPNADDAAPLEVTNAPPPAGSRSRALLDDIEDLSEAFARHEAAKDGLVVAPPPSVKRRILRGTSMTVVLVIVVAAGAAAGALYAQAQTAEPEIIETIVYVEAPGPITAEPLAYSALPIDPATADYLEVLDGVAGDLWADGQEAARIAAEEEAARIAAEEEAARIAAEEAAAAAAASGSSGTGSSTGGSSSGGGSSGGTTPPSTPKVTDLDAQVWSGGSGVIDITVRVTSNGPVTANATASAPGLGTISLSGPGTLDGTSDYTGRFTGVPDGSYTVTVKVGGVNYAIPINVH